MTYFRPGVPVNLFLRQLFPASHPGSCPWEVGTGSHLSGHGHQTAPLPTTRLPDSKWLSSYPAGTDPRQYVPDLPPGITIISHCN